MASAISASKIRTPLLKGAASVGLPLEESVERAGTSSEPAVVTKDALQTSSQTSYWKAVHAAEVTAPVALDYSLAFHCLQEARQELHHARSAIPTLPLRERESLLARCLANLARAEQWVARSGPKTMMPPPRPLSEPSRLQAHSEGP